MTFKPIKDNPNYEINEDGVVRNSKTKKELNSSFSNGQLRVSINGKTKYINRLVAENFIKNPKHKTDVFHIDRNKRNNHFKNLKWATHGETQRRSYNLGTDAPGGYMPPKTILVVETGEIFPSIRSCAKAKHISPSSIRKCISGQIEKSKGLTFKLVK